MLIKIDFSKLTYSDSTIETASFKTLSPNTSAYKSTSTFWSVNIASTVTGSVADYNFKVLLKK